MVQEFASQSGFCPLAWQFTIIQFVSEATLHAIHHHTNWHHRVYGCMRVRSVGLLCRGNEPRTAERGERARRTRAVLPGTQCLDLDRAYAACQDAFCPLPQERETSRDGHERGTILQ